MRTRSPNPSVVFDAFTKIALLLFILSITLFCLGSIKISCMILEFIFLSTT